MGESFFETTVKGCILIICFLSIVALFLTVYNMGLATMSKDKNILKFVCPKTKSIQSNVLSDDGHKTLVEITCTEN